MSLRDTENLSAVCPSTVCPDAPTTQTTTAHTHSFSLSFFLSGFPFPFLPLICIISFCVSFFFVPFFTLLPLILVGFVTDQASSLLSSFPRCHLICGVLGFFLHFVCENENELISWVLFILILHSNINWQNLKIVLCVL